MLRFLLRLFKRHYISYFDNSKFDGISRILLQYLASVIICIVFHYSGKTLSDSATSSLLAAVSLFSSILIAVLVQLHGQLSSYSQHYVEIKQDSSTAIPEHLKIGITKSLILTKIEISQHLFGNISFSLLMSLILTALLSLVITFESIVSFAQIGSDLIVFLLSIMLFSVFEIVRRLYTLLNDDFIEAKERLENESN